MGKHIKRHRIKTIHYAGFSIRETRKGYFIIDRQVNGHRIRKGFNNLQEAKFKCQQIDTEIKNKGAESVQISDEQRIELNRLHKLLNGRNVSIAQCVEFWIMKHPDNTIGETWQNTADRYLRSMINANRRKASISDKKLKLSIIGEKLGNDLMHTIDNNEMRLALDLISNERGWTADTRHAYESAGRTLIRFFNGEGKRMKKQDDEKPPVTWTVDFTRQLLYTAEKTTPEIVAGLAIMLFAGLRPYEALRLEWNQVNLDEGFIQLRASQTKTRKGRIIEISDNLAQWLKAYQDEGQVLPSQARFRRFRERLMKAVKMDKWVTDTPRHTCGTMMYARHGGNYVSRNLGHSIETYLKHYDGHPPTPAQIKRFWDITPESEKKKGNLK